MSDTTEKVIIQVDLNADRVKEALINTNDKIELLKKQLQSANQELKKMEAAGDTNSVTYSELQEKIVGYNTQLKANVNIGKAYEQQLVKSAQAGLLEKDSLAQKRAALASASIEIANAVKVNGQYDAETLKLIENSKRLKEEILAEAGAFGSTVENVGNYKQAIKEANLEAQKAERDFRNGLISKEDFQVAIQKLGELKDAQQDFNATAAASTNEGRVAAFAKGLSGLAGGIAAAQGAMALFGDESENVQKALLKVQSAMAISQGLKEFAGLPDTLKALSVSLGIATTATATNTVAKEVNNAVTGQQVVVQQAALVTTEQLSAAMTFALGPIGLVAIGIGAVVAAFAIFSGEDYAAEIDNLTKSIESENKAHTTTIDKMKQLSDARIADKENILAIAEAEGKSAEEIKKLQEEVISSKRAGLQSEVAENETHYQELTAQRNAASQALLKDLDEEEIKKAQASLDAAEKEIKAIEKRNAEIQVEAKKLNTELEIIDIEAEKRKEKIANEAATIRVSNIRNNRQREIETEKLALAQKIEELKKDEDANTELIYETRQASLDKINAINLKFDIEAAENRNKLAILKTAEGTEARLEVEIEGINKLRSLQLREAGLTETEKQIVVKESEEKIFALRQERINRESELNRAEVEAVTAREIAILNAKKSVTTDPAQKSAIDLEILKAESKSELEAIDFTFQEKKAKIESSYAFEITAAASNAGAVKELTDKKNREIALAEQTASTQKIALVSDTTSKSLEIITKGKQDELSLEVFHATQRFGLIEKGTTKELDAKIELIKSNAELSKLQYADDAQARVNIDAQANQDILQAQSDFIAARIQAFAEFTNNLINLSSLAAQNDAVNDQNKLAKQAKADDIEKARLKKELDNGVLTQQQYEEKIFAIDQKMAEKQKALKIEQFTGQRDADVIQSIINTALGVTKALPNLPLAAITAAFGLTQTALIASRPIPEFHYGGVIDGRSHAQGGVPALVGGRTAIELEGGEAIINKRAVANPMYRSILSDINSSTGGVRFAGGGIPDYSFVTQSASSPIFDQFVLQNAMIAAVRELPNPIVAVEDINIGQANTQVRESRASS